MKINIIILFVLFIIINEFVYSQKQVKIPWPSIAESPWPFLRGDMQCTGRSEFIGPGTNNILWQKDMPLGIDVGPVIGYNDILFMGELALSPDSVNYFYAVDKYGNDEWIFQTISGYPNNIAPLVAYDSTIYFGSRNTNLYALFPNGELKWQLEEAVSSAPGLTISLAKNGDLYIPGRDTLWIIDASGSIKNKVHIPDLQRTTISFSVGGDTIFYSTGPGFYPHQGALNAAGLNGELYWSFEFATNNRGTPLVDNQNKVYVFGTDSLAVSNYYLYCIKSDGTLAWRYKIPGYHNYSSPTIDKKGNIIFHTVLLYDSLWNNSIVSLDYNGNLNWYTPLDNGDFFDNYIDHGLICDAEGKIYCGSSNGGYFYCLESSGDILWKLGLGEYEFTTSPAIGSDGTLYIGTGLSSLTRDHKDNLIAVRDNANSVQQTTLSTNGFSLEQNYPNPFNPGTKINYSISNSGIVTLIVYDILGKEVATLVNDEKSAGSYEVKFDGSNLASGIYIYRLTAEDFTTSKKLILLK